MTPTIRPITSREYKLLLNTNTSTIASRERSCLAYAEFLVRNQGDDIIPDPADPDKDQKLRRTTW